jgi:hypothetical protein
MVGGCGGTRFGCCDDAKTGKVDDIGTNCDEFDPPLISTEPPMVGGCISTQFGCCDDKTTGKADEAGTNCGGFVGGCGGTQFGCCDGAMAGKVDAAGTNCDGFVSTTTTTTTTTTAITTTATATTTTVDVTPATTDKPMVGGCAGTQLGCCDDKTTGKVDAAGTNCDPANADTTATTTTTTATTTTTTITTTTTTTTTITTTITITIATTTAAAMGGDNDAIIALRECLGQTCYDRMESCTDEMSYDDNTGYDEWSDAFETCLGNDVCGTFGQMMASAMRCGMWDDYGGGYYDDDWIYGGDYHTEWTVEELKEGCAKSTQLAAESPELQQYRVRFWLKLCFQG